MTTPRDRGVMGPWFYSAADAAIKGRIAHNDARHQAALGVPREDAEAHAFTASWLVFWGQVFLVGAWAWAALMGLVLLTTVWVLPYLVGHLLLTIEVQKRLRQWRIDPANMVRVYEVPTNLVVIAWFTWGFFGWYIPVFLAYHLS